MDSDRLLGDFLRERREAAFPCQVGLLGRQTPGLRRDEVAILAGISTDYYIRLEEGLERHPSGRILDALVRLYALGPDAATHLYDLAQLCPIRHGAATERVSPGLVALIRSWPATPALVCGRFQDVLAINQSGSVLYDGLVYRDNLLRMAFLDPEARTFYLDWERMARARVAQLRAAASLDVEHPYLTELVGELSLKSEEFRRLWAGPDIGDLGFTPRRLHHAVVGDLDVTGTVYNVNRAPGQQLLLLKADPGSASEQSLILLSGLDTTP
ncbi:transcriptional regulator [Acrocarpospora phusangensis]|uniref:Transcriptional regulator n=1 Tax=Acrocarpospora phusangensis TaxID=1070424 RepID=A0A919QC16_9ACTN|nr:helix-turn-helix transcriptional regulator [Acrocarpospora phusangensis]GIH25898.1 transcriptional regulator [Acrocarpospora phusangensis]